MTKMLAVPTLQGRFAFQHRISSVLVYLYLLLILVAFAWIPVSASRWQSGISSGFFISFFVGICFLGSALWVFLLGRQDQPGQAFALFAASSAFCLASLFNVFPPNPLTPIWIVSLAFAGGGLFQLAWTYPEDNLTLASRPYLRHTGYLAALLLGFFALACYSLASWRRFSVPILLLEVIFLAGSGIFFLILTGARRVRSPSPIVREQSRLILWSAAISLAPMSLWILFSALKPGALQPALGSAALLLLPLAVSPVLIAYTLLRYRIPSIDSLLSQFILYALLSILVAGSYSLIVAGTSLVIGKAVPGNHPLLIGLLVLSIAAGLNPLRQFLQQRVDQVFFQGQAVHRERLQTFSHELTQVLDLQDVVRKLREYTHQGLFPKPLHIFLYDPLSDSYTATRNETGRVSTDLRFSAASALIKTLSTRRSPLFLGWIDIQSIPLRRERASLALLDTQLFIPLPGRERLVGWIALGPRLSGKPYKNSDISYLDAICVQAALAIERSQVFADMQRRVHEMDVLSQVTQGINITLEYDDLLELIYTQTNRILPGRDFRILLKNPGCDQFTYIFYIEDDDRRFDLENIPIPSNLGLEEVVIRSRQARISDDYERECRYSNAQPAAQGLFAWMGIPLNARNETIGVLSIGSRDPSFVYTQDQRLLLQAIADQAAGAIVKARLLHESQRRSRQLATLNEIGRNLTSTLELGPLLNQILKGATEILNCEAGSLFLVDKESGELVFEVTAGPVAENLVGQRLPPGTGLVSQALAAGQSIIANDARHSQGWFGEADRQTGFTTRDLLVVPLQIKDCTIGVIEVINKRDGVPFLTEDRDLLWTFASQAAIAVENARLYMQTDRALAARVEELSVLQQIDQQLNASLDIFRALHLTLEWALRQSVGLSQVNHRFEAGKQAAREALAGLGDQTASLGFLRGTPKLFLGISLISERTSPH